MKKVNITNLYIHLVPVLQELCNVNKFFSLLEIPVYFLVIQGKNTVEEIKGRKKKVQYVVWKIEPNTCMAIVQGKPDQTQLKQTEHVCLGLQYE